MLSHEKSRKVKDVLASVVGLKLNYFTVNLFGALFMIMTQRFLC